MANSVDMKERNVISRRLYIASLVIVSLILLGLLLFLVFGPKKKMDSFLQPPTLAAAGPGPGPGSSPVPW